MESLPDYYWGNELAERVAIAFGNEIDRLEAHADARARGLIPALADDDHDALADWERVLELPVRPPAATVEQRRAKVLARFQAASTSQSRELLAALQTAAGAATLNVYENTPVNLVDTIEVPFDPGTYNAAQVEALALVMWPAHRGLEMRYSAGFLLDASRLDQDSL